MPVNYPDTNYDARTQHPPLTKRHQLLRGNDKFVMPDHADLKDNQLGKLYLTHMRRIALNLAKDAQQCPDQNEAMARAYQSGAYKMVEIAGYFGVHYRRLARQHQELGQKSGA